MINKKEAYIALFAILVGICNIFFIILKANTTILGIFSFAMTLSVFYFAWRELQTLDFIKQIRTIMLLSAMEQDIAKAMKNAVKAVKDAKAPAEWNEESEDR